MSSNNKFTDRDIAKLYMQARSHYVDLKKLKCSDSTTLFSTMYQNFHQSIENKLFGELSNDEKDRAFKLFKFILESFEEFKHESIEREHVYIINQSDPYILHTHCCYGRHQHDLLFNLTLCTVIIAQGHHMRGPCNPAYPSVVHTGGGIIHTGGGDGGKTGHEVLLFLLAILLIACSIAAIAITGMYLMNRVSTDIERLTYNEGVARALISLALTAAVGLAIAAACTTVIALNFTGIALIPAIFVGVAAAFTGAALTGIAYNYFADKLAATMNPHAMIPSDPHHFKLTNREARNLESRGIDPDKTRCAIAALSTEARRIQLGYKTGDKRRDNGTPHEIGSVFYRVYSNKGNELHKILSKVRDLRAGRLSEISVNGMKFDLADNSRTPASRVSF